MTSVLANANMIDGLAPEPRLKANLVIQEGRIQSVAAELGRTVREGARVIDLQGTWLLPGLWDAHSHMVSPRHAPPDETPMDRFLRQGREAMDAFQRGITAQRVVGAASFSDVAWRRAFDRGLFLGPRLAVAGHLLVPTGGHMAHKDVAQQGDGPADFRRLVREQVRAGVDLIKVATTGGVQGPEHESTDHVHFLPDELAAVCETARDRGLPVAVHAGNPQGVKAAVRAGVHSIEHGYVLDEEAIALMAQHGTYYVPTLRVTLLTEEAASSPYEKEYVARWPSPSLMRQRANALRPGHLEAFRMALAAGVRIASGSDAGPLADTSLIEVELLVRCGMTPMQALVAATRHAAEAAGVGDRVGTVAPGKLADLIVVAQSPLEDISNIRTLRMVFKAGELVVHKD
ncbi:MAG: amidohydrolase family protein [Chloroflexi bacterium]|nr:amidohydrolase family protein [Chloroflexota bacterium]